MAKTMEEIWETALRDWKKKHNSDVNWMKCRIDGAWRSGYTNAIEKTKEIVEASKEEAYEKGYNDGFECGQHEVTKLEYQKGLEDAWLTAKRISLSSCTEMDDLFDVSNWTDIYDFPPESVIEKLKAYDEQKKAEEEAKIKVGDEVTDGRFYGFVTYIKDNVVYVVMRDGSCEAWSVSRDGWKKTGRHFQQVAEVLKAMEESNG